MCVYVCVCVVCRDWNSKDVAYPDNILLLTLMWCSVMTKMMTADAFSAGIGPTLPDEKEDAKSAFDPFALLLPVPKNS